MDTTMCRIDEQDFPIEPRQLTREKWQKFRRRVTERAQQDRQQVLRAAAIALPRALLAGGLLWREPARADSEQGV